VLLCLLQEVGTLNWCQSFVQIKQDIEKPILLALVRCLEKPLFCSRLDADGGHSPFGHKYPFVISLLTIPYNLL